MSSKNGLLLVFVVLCLGGLAWLVWNGGKSEPQALGLSGPAASSSVQATADASLAAGESTQQPEAARDSREVLATPELAANAKTKAPVAAAVGTKLVGRVVDDRGAPIASANVRVNGGPEEFLRLGSRDAAGKKARDVVTDAQGKFEWPGVQPGANQLVVRADAFAPLEKSIAVPADVVHDVGDLRLSLGAVLSGHVIDSAGRGVSAAQLHLVEDGLEWSFGLDFLRREPLATTSADGSFRIASLACGPWQILVHSDDHPDRTFKGTAERPGGEESGLVFELERGTTIDGLALGVPSDQQSRARVRALSLEDKGALGFARGQRTREAEIGPDGRFTLRGLSADQRWQLQLRGSSSGNAFDLFRQRARSSPVRAQSGESGVQLRWQQDSGIALQVVDAKTNQPIEKLDVSGGQGWRIEPVRGVDGRPQRQFPAGRVRLGDMYPSAESDRATIELHAAGYADWKREDLTLLSEADIDLGVVKLDPVPTVVVTVRDAGTSAPIADARVTLRAPKKQSGDTLEISMRIEDDGEGPEMNDGTSRRRARTDEHGVATLSSLPGETCTLRVEAEGHAAFELAKLELPKEGRYDQEVRLSAGGAVLVTVSDTQGRPIAGLTLDHRAPSARGPQLPFGPRQGQPLVTDSKGEVLVRNLEVGTHMFRLAEDGGGRGFRMGRSAAFTFNGMDEEQDKGWTKAEVVEGGIANVALQTVPRASLSGTVREGGAALAGATLSLEVDNGDEEDGPMFGTRVMRVGGPGGSSDDARSDGEGAYLLEGRKPGKYKLTVEHASRAMPATFAVELREGTNRFDVALLLTSIEGRVTNHEGKPIAGVRVKAERHRPSGSRQMSFFAIAIDDGGGEAVTIGDPSDVAPGTTNADGYYTLRGVTPDVELVVKAEAKDCQPQTSDPVRLAPGEAKQGVDLSLARGGKIEIEAVDGQGKPARMALATATPEGGGEPKTGVIGQSGMCQLTGLKPGMYRVSVRRMGPPGGGGSKNPADQTIEVQPDKTATATFELL